MLLGMA
ncbi:hypothetical protein YPPY76_2063, partial [Yersinia pestis PY-76]